MKIIRRPAPFVLAATGHGTLITNRNDYRMVNSEQGYGVGFQLFNTSYFDPEEVSSVLNLLALRRELFGPGVVAIDGGANIGVHTVEWAKSMYGWGNVIAVEAQERIYYALAGNIAINNCFNASALHAALGATSGSLDIPIPNYLKPASFGSLELKHTDKTEFIGQEIDYSPAHSQRINQLSIDALNLPRLDFLKLDIEGMELEALEGAKQSIEKHKPQMLIEAIKTDKEKLIQVLTDWGYKIYMMEMNVLAIHESDPSVGRVQISGINTKS